MIFHDFLAINKIDKYHTNTVLVFWILPRLLDNYFSLKAPSHQSKSGFEK